MSSSNWTRIKALFGDALERPERERAAFLDRACRDAPALRVEVEALLAAHERAEATHAFVSPLARDERAAPVTNGDEVDGDAAATERAEAGRRVGPYRLVRQIGRGGMGNVYLAERVDGQFRQMVALKLIRRGLDTDDVLARFAFERQILAGLDHPNIARIYDGGITDDDRPYFAMEYVEGEPITDYCDRHRLSVPQRLALFRTVCSAVQHAHRNLVVHRDLKPSNILVTDAQPGDSEAGGPQIKLLDFGIAKLLSNEALGASLVLPRTRTGSALLTPEYAAPEQVRGEPITTATDVYQLGVLLYELLTGRRPYRLTSRMHREIVRIILHEEPEPPSTAVSRAEEPSPEERSEVLTPERVSRARATEPAKLQRRLAGDLDVICLKALKKERERRYEDVEALADDLHRYTTGLPVAARPDTLHYRAGKFVRRHRSSVIAAVLILVSLVGGTAAALWQARIAEQQRERAEQRLADVRQLAGSFLFEFHDAIADLPGSTAARQLVVQRALEYLDRLSQQPDADPSLQLELATAYRKVGDVQGNPTNANLGRTSEALDSYRRGLELVQDVLRHDSTHVEARSVRANLYEKLGDVQAAMGELAAAEASKRRAVDTYRRLAHRADADAESRTNYAVALIKLGDLLGNPNFTNRCRSDEAVEQYREAEALLERLYTADSSATRTMRLFGLIYERIGTMHDEGGRSEAALQAYRRSLALRERYADAQPRHTDAIRDRAIAHEKMGDMLVQTDDLDAARRQYRRSRDIFHQLVEADPANVQAQQSLAISYIHLGDLAYHPSQPSFSEPDAARRHFETARYHLDAVHRVDSAHTRTRSLMNLVSGRLARLP